MVIWLGLDIIKIKPPKTGSNRIPKAKFLESNSEKNADVIKNPRSNP